jgi:hypothetical protein
MRASDFEFKYRFWIFGAIIFFAFFSYYPFLPINVSQCNSPPQERIVLLNAAST